MPPEVFAQEWDPTPGRLSGEEKGGPMIDRSIPRHYRWKVRERLAALAYVAEHGLKPAARRFALDRKTVRAWRDRWRAHGTPGLVPQYPRRRPRRIPAPTVALIAQAVNGRPSRATQGRP